MKKKYAFGLDAVRVLAVVLVSLTHQVVRTGNYNYQPGIVWVFTMLCFYLSHSCVPLFLLLSGYLCGEKRPQKSYFRGIFRVAVPYLLISVLCVLKLWLWDRDPSMKFTTAIYWILSFRANEYAWYVEMYLGLFLMIPFLNLGYDAIPSRKWKAVLLGILAFFSSIMMIINRKCNWEYIHILQSSVNKQRRRRRFPVRGVFAVGYMDISTDFASCQENRLILSGIG